MDGATTQVILTAVTAAISTIVGGYVTLRKAKLAADQGIEEAKTKQAKEFAEAREEWESHLREELQRLRVEREGLEKRVADLSREVHQLRTDVQAYQANEIRLKAEIAKYELENTRLRARVLELEAQMAALNGLHKKELGNVP